MKPAPPVTRTRSPIGRRIWAAPIGAATRGLLAGCGGGGSTAPRRAAEPAESPPLRAQVSVLRGGSVAATLPAPHQPGGVAIAGPYVILVAVSACVLQAYDAAKLRTLGTTSAGVGPSDVVAAGTLAFVAETQGEAIPIY